MEKSRKQWPQARDMLMGKGPALLMGGKGKQNLWGTQRHIPRSSAEGWIGESLAKELEEWFVSHVCRTGWINFSKARDRAEGRLNPVLCR